jgi:predicted HicB family RNase H-like nuclease
MTKPGKYADLIQQARKPEDQKTILPEETDGAAEPVNLSIRVPKSLRRHWVAEAKRQDTSITAVVIAALTARFGEPS